MKSKIYQPLIVLLCTMLVMNPAGAKHGSDDTGGDDNSSKASITTISLKPTQQNTDKQLKGEMRYSEKPRRNLKELEISVKAGFGPGRTFTSFNEARNATLTGNINGLECTLDFDRQITGKRVEFKLRIREKNGAIEIRDGDCAVDQFPSLGPVTIEHDQDDDPVTPNRILLQNN